MQMGVTTGAGVTALAGQGTVYGLFQAQARFRPEAEALRAPGRSLSYAGLDARARRLASVLAAQGVTRGDRIALLSENRFEYIEVQLAAAHLGLIVACLNWRLSASELDHCARLVTPKLVLVSGRFRAAAEALRLDLPLIDFERDYEGLLAQAQPRTAPVAAEPEDGLVVLYTSGTTGLPKGALISHRAEIARMCAARMDLGISASDGFVAWAPMFHMGSTDQMLSVLMSGGTVHVVDGFVAPEIVGAMRDHALGWMLLMPGSIEPVVEILKRDRVAVRGIRAVGAMIDLVPRALAIELTELTGSRYLNSFGSTETGLPPGSGRLMSARDLEGPLSKRASSLVEVMLVDPEDREVAVGEPGEMAVRGPTLFSGYWEAPEVNAKDFRGGRFHMGDMFRRNEDGSFDFVDRSKYMIKSGGENIYPAEVERVLLADPRVRDAVVVRKHDPKWGEIPVAVIARHTEALDAAAVEAICRAALAGYKRPRAVHFVDFDAFPRSTTGKIMRHEVEKMIG